MTNNSGSDYLKSRNLFNNSHIAIIWLHHIFVLVLANQIQLLFVLFSFSSFLKTCGIWNILIYIERILIIIIDITLPSHVLLLKLDLLLIQAWVISTVIIAVVAHGRDVTCILSGAHPSMWVCTFFMHCWGDPWIIFSVSLLVLLVKLNSL